MVIILPPDGEAGWRWLRLSDDGGVVARGEGVPAGGEAEALIAATVIVPAATIAVHWLTLPTRSTAQAAAAARTELADAVLTPLASQHVAVGTAAPDGRVPVAVVPLADMTGWIAALQEQRIDPEVMIPASLLIAAPEEGFVRADFGAERIVRGVETAFVDDAVVTPLIVGDAPLMALDRDALEAALAAAVADPPLNLRQGIYARRHRRLRIERAEIRQLALLAAAVVLVTIGIAVVRIVRFHVAASSYEQRTEALARSALPAGEVVNNADHQLDEKLLALRGPGLGYTRTIGAAYFALRAVPRSEIRGFTFDTDGTLHLSIATEGEGAANDLKRQMESMGLAVRQSGTFTAAAGKVSGEFTVTPR